MRDPRFGIWNISYPVTRISYLASRILLLASRISYPASHSYIPQLVSLISHHLGFFWFLHAASLKGSLRFCRLRTPCSEATM